MGRLSKAKEARIKNLLGARQRALVEDVTTMEDPDSDFVQNTTQNAADDLPSQVLEQGFFIPGLEEDLYSDTDEGESDDEEEAGDVKTNADISMFSQILAEAQLAAVKAEREAAYERPNRKRYYTGNALRTKRYHAQKQRKLAETGQQFIQSFFIMKLECEDAQPTLHEISDSDSEEEGLLENESAQEAREHLQRLFPEDEETRSLVSTLADFTKSAVPLQILVLIPGHRSPLPSKMPLRLRQWISLRRNLPKNGLKNSWAS